MSYHSLKRKHPKDIPVEVDITPEAMQDIITQLSKDLNVSINEIQTIEFEQVDWPDACSGIGQADQACAQVITPDFKVVLEVNDQVYEFRSNEDGSLILADSPNS